MSDETKSPASEREERKTTPQTGELDAEKLDEVAGGGGSGGTVAIIKGPGAPPVP